MERKRFLLTNRARKAYDDDKINIIIKKQEKRTMEKALSEMNTKELFCALTGEYGPIRQAYVQTAFRKYKEQHGEYAEADRDDPGRREWRAWRSGYHLIGIR